MSQYHVVEPGAFHTEPKMPQLKKIWNKNNQSGMWGGQKQQEKLSMNKITQLGLLGVEWDKDSRTGKPYDVSSPFHTAVGHFEDIRNINRQSGKKKQHPIVWRIQITSEPHDTKYLKGLAKLEGKEDTTTEQIPDTDSVDKKESGKVEIVSGKDSEKLKATKEAGREESEGVIAMREIAREATREATREEAIRQEHRNVQEHHIFNPYTRPEFTAIRDRRAHPAPGRLPPSRPRNTPGRTVTEKTVTYENPEPDRYAVDDYNYAM